MGRYNNQPEGINMFIIVDFSKSKSTAPELKTMKGECQIYRVNFNDFIVDRIDGGFGVRVEYCVEGEGWGDSFAYIGVWNFKHVADIVKANQQIHFLKELSQ